MKRRLIDKRTQSSDEQLYVHILAGRRRGGRGGRFAKGTSLDVLCPRIRVVLQQQAAGFMVAPGSGEIQWSALSEETKKEQL